MEMSELQAHILSTWMNLKNSAEWKKVIVEKNVVVLYLYKV